MNLLFTTTLVALGASLAAGAQLRPRDRFPITTDQVAAKLVATFARKGIALEPRQIALPTSVTATEDTPALEIRSIQKLGSAAESTSSAVKLACTKSSVCLPFYAVVTQASTGGSSPDVQRGFSSLSDASTHTASVVKTGAKLTLLVDSGAAHIQMPVVSLQSGELNQQIKVRSMDHKQIFNVQVLGATVVKGTL